MLPLVVAGGIVGAGILAWIFGDSKDPELEAKKRGIERATRIYKPILDEMEENIKKLKEKYAFDKERFGGLIDEKALYIRKLEIDLPRYEQAYDLKMKNALENRRHSGTALAGAAALFGPLVFKPSPIDYSEILKREKRLKALEDKGFEEAKKMWEKKISSQRILLDKLKREGDAESINLIETYDDCMRIIVDLERKIAYYQERVGDLG